MGLKNGPRWETLVELALLTDEEARLVLERARWPQGPVCPRCGDHNPDAQPLRGNSHRDGVYKCRACRKQYSVTVGTLMQSSHLGPKCWLHLFVLLCGPQPVSALLLQRELGLQTYGSAWRLAQKVIAASRCEPLRTLLGQRKVATFAPGTAIRKPGQPVRNPGRRGIQLWLRGLRPIDALRGFLSVQASAVAAILAEGERLVG